MDKQIKTREKELGTKGLGSGIRDKGLKTRDKRLWYRQQGPRSRDKQLGTRDQNREEGLRNTDNGSELGLGPKD